MEMGAAGLAGMQADSCVPLTVAVMCTEGPLGGGDPPCSGAWLQVWLKHVGASPSQLPPLFFVAGPGQELGRPLRHSPCP